MPTITKAVLTAEAELSAKAVLTAEAELSAKAVLTAKSRADQTVSGLSCRVEE